MALFSALTLLVLAPLSALVLRIIYNVYFHPLSKFPGPWYAASFSLTDAVICLLRWEHEWLLDLTKKYAHTNMPVRIAPNVLLFPKPSTIKDIYWDAKHNTKSTLYGTGVLGPPHLFSTLDGNEHRALRKALGGPQWSFGALKNTWEPRIDSLILLFTSKLSHLAQQDQPIIICDKAAQFAADIMTMLSFSTPWGFVENQRDERHLLESWRDGLNFFGFAARFRWFRETVLKSPLLKPYLLPSAKDTRGMGYLIGQADVQITERERRIEEEGYTQDKPDYIQYALQARVNGKPLDPIQKRAHATLLIQAGADTTGTGLGNTLRFLTMNRACYDKARTEIAAAEEKGFLSTPIKYEETITHLPYFVACIKESLRVGPPGPQQLTRMCAKGGAWIGGYFIPGGTEMTSYSYVVHRDPGMYAPDPDAFRPERWLESEKKAAEMEAANFGFGVGPRVCLGKDIAYFEMYKLLPEIIRRFDLELVDEGRYLVAGGVAFNQGLAMKLMVREVN